MQHDYVNASYVYASLDLAGLDAQQLLLAGEAHFRAGLATKTRICFRDAIRAFRRTLKTHGQTADTCCWLARSYGYLALYSWFPGKMLYALTSKRFVERALQINPRHALSAYVLAMWNQKMPIWLGGNTRLVTGYLDMAVEHARDRIMFRIARARWNLKQGIPGLAHADLSMITGLCAFDPEDDRRKIEALELLAKHYPQGSAHVPAAVGQALRRLPTDHSA